MNKLTNFIINIFMLSLIVSMIYFVLALSDQKAQCIADPLVYGVSTISEHVANMSCVCSFNHPMYQSFYVDSYGTQALESANSNSNTTSNNTRLYPLVNYTLISS